jgi:hypothetical protein
MVLRWHGFRTLVKNPSPIRDQTSNRSSNKTSNNLALKQMTMGLGQAKMCAFWYGYSMQINSVTHFLPEDSVTNNMSIPGGS